MKIAIDARCLNRAHLRGMGKYVWNVLKHMPAEEVHEWLLFGDRPDLPRHVPDLPAAEFDAFDHRGFRFQLWEQSGLPAKLTKQNADVFHATSTTLPWWQSVPTVVTVHDTIPWNGGEECKRTFYWRHLIPRAYRNCSSIITISENSREDILRLWPDLEDRLHVIPHGVEPQYLQVISGVLGDYLEAAGVRMPYLLYLGGAIARKRLDWAIKVWQRVNDEDLQLVICGLEPKKHAHYLEQVRPEMRANLCLPSFVPEEVMPRLYQNACAVLYPTLYEGFGLPALEAQATGTPVLFSAVGSLTELSGPGAVVLPEEDLDAWVRATDRLVKKRKQNLQLNEEARAWASGFSWEESARKHLEIYRSATCNQALTSANSTL